MLRVDLPEAFTLSKDLKGVREAVPWVCKGSAPLCPRESLATSELGAVRGAGTAVREVREDLRARGLAYAPAL